MSDNNLKWFVRLGKVFEESTPKWEVMQGGFRDSTHYSKWHAEQRRDELNSLEAEEYE